MVCEGKLVLHGITGSEVLEFPRSMFDGKAITSTALLLMHLPGLAAENLLAGRAPEVRCSPLLAVGTSGGSIFVLDPFTASVRMVAVLLAGGVCLG